jgi:hypothetical protein
LHYSQQQNNGIRLVSQEWINRSILFIQENVVYTFIQYYTGIKKNRTVIFKEMDGTEIILLNEINQTQTLKYAMFHSHEIFFEKH